MSRTASKPRHPRKIERKIQKRYAPVNDNRLSRDIKMQKGGVYSHRNVNFGFQTGCWPVKEL
jgi:hypothetical protein